jgi:starch phosphorylase
MTKKPLQQSELTDLIVGLNKVARNLWWTWDQEAQEIFQELSPRGWQNLYHNAVAILHEVSDYELRVRLQDPEFAERVRHVLESFNAYVGEKETWGNQNAAALSKNPVAYFTAEFGFSGGRGTAQSKVDALEGAGVRVAEAPSQIPQLLMEAGVRPA